MRTRNTVIGLLSFLFLISFASATSVLVERGSDFNRYYDSVTGKYTLQVFNSPEYVLENSKWVHITQAKSLKGVWEVKFLKTDANFPLQVLDINFTHITINISSAVVGQIPFQWCRSSCSNSDCSLSNVACSNLTVAVTAGTRNKFQSMAIPLTAIEFDNLTWGTGSTTIQITNGNVTDDTSTQKQRSNLSYGSFTGLMLASELPAYNQEGFLKFNISDIPAGVTINEALLGLNLKGNYLDDGEGVNISATHVFNSSGGYTIDGQEWIEGTATGTTTCNTLGGANATGVLTWNSRPKTSSEFNSTYESTINFTNDSVVNKFYVWNTTNMVLTEYISGGKNITIRLNVSAIIGTTIIIDCMIFNSSEAAAGKPYLNITYTEGGGGDTTPPTYSNNGTNSTNPAPLDNVLYYTQWADDVGLSGYIFSWNATGVTCSGGFANDSFVAMTGASNWSNVTKQVPLACAGKLIGFLFYANDTSNNWNSTAVMYENEGANTPKILYDSATYAENAVKNSTFGMVLYDAGTYAELQLRNLTLTLRLYDYKTYAELLVTSALHPRTFYDSVTYSELMTKASIFPRVLYDSASYAELVVKNSAFGRVLYDAGTYAESLVKASAFFRTLSDYGTYAEDAVNSVVTGAKEYAVYLYDSAVYAESVLRGLVLSINIYDAAAYAENMVRGIAVTIRIYDAVSYAENVVASVSSFVSGVVEQAMSYIPPLNIPPVRIDFSWISVIILGCICVFGANYLRNRKPDTQDEETLNEEFPDNEE